LKDMDGRLPFQTSNPEGRWGGLILPYPGGGVGKKGHSELRKPIPQKGKAFDFEGKVEKVHRVDWRNLGKDRRWDQGVAGIKPKGGK